MGSPPPPPPPPKIKSPTCKYLSDALLFGIGKLTKPCLLVLQPNQPTISEMSSNTLAAATTTEADAAAAAALADLSTSAAGPSSAAPPASDAPPRPRRRYIKRFSLDWWMNQVGKARDQLAKKQRQLNRAENAARAHQILLRRLRSEVATLDEFARAGQKEIEHLQNEAAPADTPAPGPEN
ncbi:hypothetical protein ACHAQA_002776 [Verticillium albo-atrum]